MKIQQLYINRDVADSSIVKEICSKIPVPARIVEHANLIYEILYQSQDPIALGKQCLYLTKNKGAFIRDCPGTTRYICCNYKILHMGTYCTMDCAYCILQSYFHPPLLQYFVNHEDLLSGLHELFSGKKIFRIGTGEFTDSLIWEEIFPVAQTFISEFSGQSYGVLELKTKTAHVEHLLGLSHQRKTILAWSLNSEKIIGKSEKGTARLRARFHAARKCEAHGYPLAFHFDPLVIYPGCEADYEHVVSELFHYVSPENIVWISLGSFRFMPELKWIIERRFPDSKIIYGEFITGLDGKMRYFKPLRIQLYKKIISSIRKFAPDVLIYFCMEDDDVWKKTLGFSPLDVGGLPRLLDESAAVHCSLQASPHD